MARRRHSAGARGPTANDARAGRDSYPQGHYRCLGVMVLLSFATMYGPMDALVDRKRLNLALAACAVLVPAASLKPWSLLALGTSRTRPFLAESYLWIARDHDG